MNSNGLETAEIDTTFSDGSEWRETYVYTPSTKEYDVTAEHEDYQSGS